ncbi:MAG: T9SS type A sorting domain-containing protein [Bacteroidales bacterium]|nr:T9SS type A sorting domain-containing protein [Bacteroidales bacterium]
MKSYTKKTFPKTDGEFSIINVTKGSFGVENSTNQEILIYPNPASDVLNIASNNKIKHIEILNFIGQNFFNKKLDNNNIEINTSAFKSGIYFIRIETENGLKTKKVTIK